MIDGIMTTKGFGGLGAHIHWLKMWEKNEPHKEEITAFLGKRFFDGDKILLSQTKNPSKYSMEFWGKNDNR